jgi:predicted enzyme related to lactoylglutathione lyase
MASNKVKKAEAAAAKVRGAKKAASGAKKAKVPAGAKKAKLPAGAKKAKVPAGAKKAKVPAGAKKAAAGAKKAAPRKSASHKTRHPVVHWEIQSRDPKRLHQFFSDVFDWVIDTSNPMEYGMVASGGSEGIDGGIGGTMNQASRVLVYASVPDIDGALARISAHGGKTVMPRKDLGMVVMALYEDPEGNVLGLVEE